MKELLADYERRLETVKNMIADLEMYKTLSVKAYRLKTKASCYRTFITELKRKINESIIAENSEAQIRSIKWKGKIIE